MRGWRLRPLAATLLALTLAVELAAVALSWGLESHYDTILYAVYAVTLASAGALDRPSRPDPTAQSASRSGISRPLMKP
jgi:hypothetical protein